ncbi:MAG: phage replisome organizer N-terminal domain-containing protein [Clostridiales bacterium]
MSDNKKYYYLKVKENFYESEELIILQGQTDGYLYSDILMKLYLRSLKSEGKLMLRDKIPYNSVFLSQVVRHSVGVVEKALKIFRDLELIEVLDNGAIYMSDIQSLIGRGSSESERKARYRKKIEENKKLLKSGTLSQECPGHFPPEREIELEIELELDKEREKSKKELKEKHLCSSNDEPFSLESVEKFFKKAWSLYPKKVGKSKILKNQKKKIYRLGEEFIRCIKRYKSDPELKINEGWKEVLDGSTFFNGRYVEWTDDEYKNNTPKQEKHKTAAELKKERIIALCKKNKEGDPD